MRPNNRKIFDMNSSDTYNIFRFQFHTNCVKIIYLSEYLWTRRIEPSRRLDGWTTNKGISTRHLFPLPEITVKFFKEFHENIGKEW